MAECSRRCVGSRAKPNFAGRLHDRDSCVYRPFDSVVLRLLDSLAACLDHAWLGSRGNELTRGENRPPTHRWQMSRTVPPGGRTRFPGTAIALAALAACAPALAQENVLEEVVVRGELRSQPGEAGSLDIRGTPGESYFRGMRRLANRGNYPTPILDLQLNRANFPNLTVASSRCRRCRGTTGLTWSIGGRVPGLEAGRFELRGADHGEVALVREIRVCSSLIVNPPGKAAETNAQPHRAETRGAPVPVGLSRPTGPYRAELKESGARAVPGNR